MTTTTHGLRRRLTPLFIAAFGQGVALWVPIEKLFMIGIGFDAASVGLMAAVYAVAVPIFELPSGLLADRWSRRGVLLLATAAATASVVIGGLSPNVGTYLVSALFLGVYFAMQSGTLDSVVYDTVLEETGESTSFEATLGRLRLTESAALVASALAGAAIAQVAPLSTTYFLTVIPLAGAAVALLRFREPQLHKVSETEPLGRQLRATYRTLLQPGRLRAVVALLVVGALLMQGMLEFGPLWLVALAAPPLLYGPHWAGLTAALGLGGLLGARPWLARRPTGVLLGLVVVGCGLLLTLSRSVGLLVAAQVLLVLVVVAVSIPATGSLHDAVASSVRASVASGVGTLTWLAFVPFALLVGFVGDRAGVFDAGWLVVGVGVLAAALMVIVVPPRPRLVAQAGPAATLPTETFPADRFRSDDDPDWPGHWSAPPVAWGGVAELAGDPAVLAAVRSAITDLPEQLRRAIMLRDVLGRDPADAAAQLGVDAASERDLVHRARAQVRARLERHFDRECIDE